MYQIVEYTSAITTIDVVIGAEEYCSVTALEVYYQSFENTTIILGDSLVLPFANYTKTPVCEEYIVEYTVILQEIDPLLQQEQLPFAIDDPENLVNPDFVVLDLSQE